MKFYCHLCKKYHNIKSKIGKTHYAKYKFKPPLIDNKRELTSIEKKALDKIGFGESKND